MRVNCKRTRLCTLRSLCGPKKKPERAKERTHDERKYKWFSANRCPCKNRRQHSAITWKRWMAMKINKMKNKNEKTRTHRLTHSHGQQFFFWLHLRSILFAIGRKKNKKSIPCGDTDVRYCVALGHYAQLCVRSESIWKYYTQLSLGHVFRAAPSCTSTVPNPSLLVALWRVFRISRICTVCTCRIWGTAKPKNHANGNTLGLRALRPSLHDTNNGHNGWALLAEWC